MPALGSHPVFVTVGTEKSRTVFRGREPVVSGSVGPDAARAVTCSVRDGRVRVRLWLAAREMGIVALFTSEPVTDVSKQTTRSRAQKREVLLPR